MKPCNAACYQVPFGLACTWHVSKSDMSWLQKPSDPKGLSNWLTSDANASQAIYSFGSDCFGGLPMADSSCSTSVIPLNRITSIKLLCPAVGQDSAWRGMQGLNRIFTAQKQQQPFSVKDGSCFWRSRRMKRRACSGWSMMTISTQAIASSDWQKSHFPTHLDRRNIWKEGKRGGSVHSALLLSYACYRF